MILIAPSIIAGDLADLKSEVIKAENGKADLIHLDVMDGHFVPNITFGFSTIKALRRYCKLPFDVHLMITNPLRYIDNFIEAGSDILTLHLEVCNKDELDIAIDKIKKSNKKVGIALKPDTELPEWLIDKFDDIYLINVMSVQPGFSGQKLIPFTLKKMESINKLIKDLKKRVIIEADGGIEHENVKYVVKAGARIIVAGNAIYSKSDINKAINDLRTNALLALEEGV